MCRDIKCQLTITRLDCVVWKAAVLVGLDLVRGGVFLGMWARGLHKWVCGLAVVLLLALIPMGALSQDHGEGCTDFTAERITGIGGWLAHGDIGLSMRIWSSETSGLEVCFFAPTGGGRLWVLAKLLHRLIDTCYLDGYLVIGGGIPVGGSIDWQLINVSIGLEWGLPDLPELTFILEAGMSLVHHYHWYYGWRWRSQVVSGIGFQYYFRGGGR